MPSGTLLYVDDAPTMLQLRKAGLERLGYSVFTATDARSAIAVLEQTPVAAVLVEYKREGIDAEALAFHIKQRFPTRPLILLSAFSELPERILWLVDEYLMRSEPLERIAAIVSQVAQSADKLAPRSERLPSRHLTAG